LQNGGKELTDVEFTDWKNGKLLTLSLLES
jgi:hypothetical protein